MARTFTGSLQTKKKSELLEIASALFIDDHGTKDDLQVRIKKHLDNNQSSLEDDERFAGLYGGRRKRSAQPSDIVPPPSKRSAAGRSSESKSTRRVIALEPVFESTPAKDLSDVSTLLKNPLSPEESPSSSSSRRVTRSGLMLTSSPTAHPPLTRNPSSPTVSTRLSTGLERSVLERSIIEQIPPPHMGSIVRVAKRQEQAVLRRSKTVLLSSRAFLSNARTISILTAAFELLYIIYAITPWQYLHIPLAISSTSTPSDTPSFPAEPPVGASPQRWSLAASLVVPYPPLFAFQSSLLWTVLMHWFIPTVLIPTLAGILISFRQPTPVVPTETQSTSRELVRASDTESLSEAGSENPDVQVKTAISFDPLTSSIIRLAAQVAYPYPTRPSFTIAYGTSPTFDGYDILGFRWRVLTASVGVALAFAEAIHVSLVGVSAPLSRSQGDAMLPSRVLQPEDTMVESEVD